MDKRISMEKLLYVFGYDINWWKGDGKLLITYMFIKENEKEKEKKCKSKLHCEKKKRRKKEKRMQTKEVHNEVSISQD